VVDAGSANATLAMKRSAVAWVSPVASHPPALIGAVNVPAGAVPETDRVPATGGGGAQTTVGWVGIVVGGVGIATGAVAGVLAIGKHSTLASECPADCKQSDIDSYHAIGALSTVGFIAGGVLAGAGLVLILTAPPRTSSPAATTVTPYIGFGSFGAFGSF
jgi:hypothetical protein